MLQKNYDVTGVGQLAGGLFLKRGDNPLLEYTIPDIRHLSRTTVAVSHAHYVNVIASLRIVNIKKCIMNI